MAQDVFRSQFRLPYPLYEAIKAASERNGRSLNAEIVTRLERSLETEQMGFSGDLLDVTALQAFLTMSFAEMIDREALSNEAADVLDRLVSVSAKVVGRTAFDKTKKHVVKVIDRE